MFLRDIFQGAVEAHTPSSKHLECREAWDSGASGPLTAL